METERNTPSPFLRRMQNLLSASDFAAYLAALNAPPLRFARKNPQKRVPDDLLREETGGLPLLSPHCKPGKGALYAAGAYYVQEPAAAAVANLLPPLLPHGARVLDMCAAPGGKVTAAAAARSDCVFLANEVIFARAKILLSNIERLGLRNVTVSILRPEEIARHGARFDAIIADVPCSGEGMLRKENLYAGDLSDENVAACAVRAAKILDACHACLREGGILLFSTCTFNRTENEEQVRRFMREYGYMPLLPAERPPHSRQGFDVPEAVRFFPQDGGGEGHFACLLRKTERSTHDDRKQKEQKQRDKRVLAATDMLKTVSAEEFSPERIVTVGEGCEYLPPDYPFADFPALRRGMRLCDYENGRILPHHHFATAARADRTLHAPDYAPNAPEIAAYLGGNTFACDAPNGFRILKVAGLPLGLIKVSDGTAKNHYPKGLRI